MTTISTLPQTALLVSFSASMPTMAREDKDASRLVRDARFAQSEQAGSFRKQLFPECQTIANIKSLVRATRQYIDDVSLPWDVGQRVIKACYVKSFTYKMERFRERFEDMVSDFIYEYPNHVEAARRRLGDLFSDSDYPSQDSVRKQFAFRYTVGPISNINDWRLEVDQSTMEALREQAAASIAERETEAARAAWERVHKAVSELHEKLTQDGTVLRQSRIDSLRELADILPSLNLLDDPKLDLMARELRDKLSVYDAEVLREDEALRSEVAENARKLLEDMSSKESDDDWTAPVEPVKAPAKPPKPAKTRSLAAAGRGGASVGFYD